MNSDEDVGLRGEHALVLDEDSGSAFELSESERSISPRRGRRGSRASSIRRHRSKNHVKLSPRQSHENPRPSDADEQIREEARQWAENFIPPQSPSDIISLERPSRKNKRPGGTHSEARAKRVKRYNPGYRDLLNSDIHDVATGILHKSNAPLPQSQIGAVMWTSPEKELFFSALPRLGRDNIRGIAERIGTKSEVEVHQYIQLLQEGLMECKGHEKQKFSFEDIRPAMEISEEGCILLEKAGDAQASRQELYEEEREKTKWGDNWLVTEAVSRQLEPFSDEEKHEEAVHKLLPAADLFNLRRWLELSKRIFMNPAAPYAEDNWEALAEDGEMPAVRATAFEDFHSLTVSITKRLVSTVLYCSMSRLRAISSVATKISQVHPKDVQAALEILNMRKDSHEYWRKCARRCHLQVVDDEWLGGDEKNEMSYDEVEEVLQNRRRSRARSASRSATRSLRFTTPDHMLYSSSSSDSDLLASDNESLPGDYGYTTDLPTSGGSDTSTRPPRGRGAKQKLARIAAERAEDDYIDALDLEESRAEESHLWTLLGETPPFDIKPEPPEEPSTTRSRVDYEGNWRENTQYWSEWEVFQRPVPEESFEKNRLRMERRRARGQRRRDGGGGMDEMPETSNTESDDGDASDMAEQDVEQSEIEGHEDNDGDQDEDEEMDENDDFEDSSEESTTARPPHPRDTPHFSVLSEEEDTIIKMEY